MATYISERNKIYNEKLNKLQEELPYFCEDFFCGISMNTTILTRYNYALDLRIFFHFLSDKCPLFGHKGIDQFTLEDMEKIKKTDIERFLAYLSDYSSPSEKILEQNSMATKARKFCSVRAMFRYLYNSEKLSQNITTRVSCPKIPSKAIVRLENNEVQEVFSYLSDENAFLSDRQNTYNLNNTRCRDNAIITLLLGTGIRVSECVGLNIDDIDFPNMSFLVTRKGGKQSILYLNEEIVTALREYLVFREEQIRSKKLEDEKIDALFLSTQNKRISVRAVEMLVKKYTKLASPLKNVTPHKLRSTYGTALYRETKDIYVVAEVLGHSDINTTKKHYAAIGEDIKKQASQKVHYLSLSDGDFPSDDK